MPGGAAGVRARAAAAQLHIVLDAATRTILRSFDLPSGVGAQDFAITPDQGLLFAASGGAFLHIIDLATETYSGRVNALSNPDGTGSFSGSAERLQIDSRGQRLYVGMRGTFGASGAFAAKVGVFDVRAATKVMDLPVRSRNQPIGIRIALPAEGTLLFAGIQRDNEVLVFDTANGAEIASIPVDEGITTLTA